MNHRTRRNADKAEIVAANEAATWLQRLESGAGPREQYRYFRWLKASPRNAAAMQFMERLDHLLRTGSKDFPFH